MSSSSNVYSNVRGYTPYIDVYSNVYNWVIDYPDIVILNFNLSITTSVSIGLIR